MESSRFSDILFDMGFPFLRFRGVELTAENFGETAGGAAFFASEAALGAHEFHVRPAKPPNAVGDADSNHGFSFLSEFYNPVVLTAKAYDTQGNFSWSRPHQAKVAADRSSLSCPV